MTPRSHRYRTIIETLSVHGFGFAVGATGMTRRFPFRRGLPGHEAGRNYTQPEHLRLALEELGATFVKLGQILSTRPDLLPPGYVAELARLQDDVTPVPAQAIMATLAEELDDVSVLESFESAPLASASIGQAHAAKLQGTDVVVKIRRPQVVETVASDLEILHDLAERASRHWPTARDNDIVGIAREFADTLRRELDYLREAHNAERFAANFADDPDVHIPAVFWQTTTSRVLTLERLGGVKIDDIAGLEAAGHDRRQLAVRAARVICKMVFDDGFFHADPHPGNFFVEAGGRLGIVDFGMTGEITDTTRARLVAFMVELMGGDPDGTAAALLELAPRTPDVDRAALRADLAPLVARIGGLSLADLSTTEMLGDIMALARRHHIHLESDLALLFKTLIMAEGLGQQLDPEFRIADVLMPFAERAVERRFSADQVARTLAGFARDMLDTGYATPRGLRALIRAMEHGGFDVHVHAADLQKLVDEADRIGNRLIAGAASAALISGLARTQSAAAGRWSVGHRGHAAVQAGVLAALGVYLGKTSRRRPR